MVMNKLFKNVLVRWHMDFDKKCLDFTKENTNEELTENANKVLLSSE